MKISPLFISACLVFLQSSQIIFAEPPRPSSKELPFPISEKQRISKDDLDNKPEGWYPVFIPILFSDATLGTGYGLTAMYMNNGKKNDPLFEYTPYRDALSVAVVNSTKGMQMYHGEYSKKYINDTPYSIHFSGGYEKISNALYFGIGQESMKPLSHRYRNQPENELRENLPFSEYEENLVYRRPSRNASIPGQYETDKMYNRYLIETPYLDAIGDKIFSSVFKFSTGISTSKTIIRTFDSSVYDSPNPLFSNTPFKIGGTPFNANADYSTPHGKTKLTEDKEAGKIFGYNGGFMNLIRFGFAYDTRDFSLDPNRGILFEITHEISRKVIGSDFHFSKTFSQLKLFANPFSGTFNKLVFASRFAFANTSGKAPFFTYSSYNGTDSYLVALGGASTLRGYQLSRFLGPVAGFANFEVRWKFHETTSNENHFTFHLIPFFDTGRVWDKIREVQSFGFARSYGLGFQISYNLSTILRFDFAKSREDRTFNFQMSQPF
ncbi:MAG: BamA/TamA family outer membrane protein [Leptospiraceae bacterium]|nr:BamA/TamA family outer membrane protein [Leptospiraceae bacterium]